MTSSGLSPESQDDEATRFRVRASARPGMTEPKKRDGIAPVASQLLFLAGPGAESALVQSVKSLAGDPSEVTALGVRHWITSLVEISIYAVNRALLRGRNRGMNC